MTGMNQSLWLSSHQAEKYRHLTFFMAYNREARLPVDFSISPICHDNDDNINSVHNFVKKMMQVRDDLKPKAVRNI